MSIIHTTANNPDNMRRTSRILSSDNASSGHAKTYTEACTTLVSPSKAGEQSTSYNTTEEAITALARATIVTISCF
jgi:hypothetical protein